MGVGLQTQPWVPLKLRGWLRSTTVDALATEAQSTWKSRDGRSSPRHAIADAGVASSCMGLDSASLPFSPGSSEGQWGQKGRPLHWWQPPRPRRRRRGTIRFPQAKSYTGAATARNGDDGHAGVAGHRHAPGDRADPDAFFESPAGDLGLPQTPAAEDSEDLLLPGSHLHTD